MDGRPLILSGCITPPDGCDVVAVRDGHKFETVTPIGTVGLLCGVERSIVTLRLISVTYSRRSRRIREAGAITQRIHENGT
jgi:hypothetical protein